MQYELYHHGVKGQKWGVRRYQNKDGTLTPTGKKRSKRASGLVKTTVQSSVNSIKHPVRAIKLGYKIAKAGATHPISGMRYSAKSLKALIKKDTRKKLLNTLNSGQKNIDDITKEVGKDFFKKYANSKVEDLVSRPETAAVSWYILRSS